MVHECGGESYCECALGAWVGGGNDSHARWRRGAAAREGGKGISGGAEKLSRFLSSDG